MSIELLIGLGNPGRKYAKTRHNIGFVILDRLAQLNGFDIKKRKFKAKYSTVSLFDKEICLIKPLSFMNLCGEVVETFRNYFQVDISTNVLLVHDDIDLPLGKLRLSFGSGSGGHNGIRSIIDWVETKDFYRLRFGVGRPPVDIDPADFVLHPFEEEEKGVVQEAVEKAVAAIEYYYTQGPRATMQSFNS